MSVAMSVQEVEDLLDNISTLIGGFLYDKAKEVLEKEREAAKLAPQSPWNGLVNGLTQLSSAERQYMSLVFLTHKSFLRKDSSARVCYEALSLELQRALDTLAAGPLRLCLAHVYSQLLVLVSGRLFLLQFYEKLWLVGSGKVRSVSELVEQLYTYVEEHEQNFNHHHMKPLKAVFGYEARSLLSLLRAQQQLESWQFLPALMHLNAASAQLARFSGCVQARETRRLVFLRSWQEPELLQWYQRLRAALIATFSLYFRDVLSRQASAAEFRALCAKTAADHYARLQSFQRKCDAALVVLVYQGEDGGLGGRGYRHPDSSQRPPPPAPHGYPAIVSCARAEAQAAVWPALMAALAEPHAELATGRVVHCTLGAAAAQSAFLIQVSPLITLAVVFDTKRSERDSYVSAFLQETAAALRCSRNYLSLRPGAK